MDQSDLLTRSGNTEDEEREVILELTRRTKALRKGKPKEEIDNKILKDKKTVSDSNLVIVGTKKPILNYVTACITAFNNGEQKIKLRARGKAINNVVEVSNLLKNKFINNVKIADIKINGEEVIAPDGKNIRLPFMEITLNKD
tara:strand:- start:1282 stop:1710 length:429 start_codon:yes stop_codon:yes gene_type:complete